MFAKNKLKIINNISEKYEKGHTNLIEPVKQPHQEAPSNPTLAYSTHVQVQKLQ